jgi:hypothetical protein
MRHLFSIAAATLLFSCNDGDFINHTLVAEKAGSCTGADGAFNMVSNTSGERYTFSVCLPEGYDTKKYTVTRKGDTIFVAFPPTQTGEPTKTALFKMTLDIDAKPRYNFIKLGEDLVAVTSQRQSY